MKPLLNRRIVILTADGYERNSLHLPREALTLAGATTEFMSLVTGSVRAEGHPPDKVEVWEISPPRIDFCDGILIPDGEAAASALINHPPAQAAILHIAESGKSIAVIGTGLRVLSHLGLLEGRMVSGHETMRSELVEGGSIWMNAPFTTDGLFVSARSGKDLMHFNIAMVDSLTRVTPLNKTTSPR